MKPTPEDEVLLTQLKRIGEIWDWGDDDVTLSAQQAHARLRELLAENAELWEIVGRLPRTADGAVITLGMHVWIYIPHVTDDWPAGVYECYVDGFGNDYVNGNPEQVHVFVTCVNPPKNAKYGGPAEPCRTYSTRAAAEAALQETNSKF